MSTDAAAGRRERQMIAEALVFSMALEQVLADQARVHGPQYLDAFLERAIHRSCMTSGTLTPVSQICHPLPSNNSDGGCSSTIS